MHPIVIQELLKGHKQRVERIEVRYRRYMQWLHGDFWADDPADPEAEGLADTNYSYAFLDSMVAGIVPTNPRVTITDLVGKNEKAAKMRQAVANATLRQTDATRLLWRAATQTGVRGSSFLRADFSRKQERIRFSVRGPQHVWHDQQADSWDQIRYLIEVVPIYASQFRQRQEKKNGYRKDASPASQMQYPDWLLPVVQEEIDAAMTAVEWVVIYEVYDFVDHKYYHVLEDVEKPLFEHDRFPLEEIGNRFFPIIFNDAIDALAGISDIKLIERLQTYLNELDTVALQHAQSSIPIPVVDTKGLDNPDDFIKNYARATSPRDVIPAQIKGAKTLADVLTYSKSPPISLDMQRIRDTFERAIHFILALPLYERGVVGQADIATEVALAQEGVKTRNGRRYVTVNNSVRWMGRVSGTIAAYRFTSTKYVRDSDGKPLAIEPRVMGKVPMNRDEDIYDYDVTPFSPPEDSVATKLRNAEKILDRALQRGDVIKVRELFVEMFDLLGFDPSKFVMSPEEMAQAAQAAAVAAGGGQPGAGAPPPPGADQINPDYGVLPGPGGEVPGIPTGNSMPPGVAGGPGV